MEAALDDDGPVRMTVTERSVWASAIAVALTSGGYLALVAGRLRERPAAEVAWAGPMLWAMGLAIAGSILLTIVFTVAAAIAHRDGGRDQVTADVRDAEIGRFGGRAGLWVLSVGAAGALGLAMLDAGSFWIGNLLFVSGTAGALVEAGLRLRLYRRGF